MVLLTGAGYIAQLEHEYMHLYKLSVCNNCFALGFQKQLRRCTGCKIVDYCSTECQKAHWKRHKSFCNMVQGKSAKNAYLSSQHHDNLLRLIIDSYKLRTELDHARRKEDHGRFYAGNLADGLIWARGDATDDFQHYLDLAEEAEILPEWWNFETRMECLAKAVDQSAEDNIFQRLNQSKLVTKYGTSIHPALCILAELIVGYDGKGPAKNKSWYYEFRESLDQHPEEREKLIQGTIEAIKQGLQDMDRDVPAELLSFKP